jgi:predicted adenylyl cyclase CyaB
VGGDDHSEQELKIPVDDLGPVREGLRSRGARQLSGFEREVNLLFDDQEGSLERSDQVLRVRRVGGRCLLTFKGPPTFVGPVKRRDELETEAAEAEVIEEILKRLGLRPVVRYEKDRERWALEGAEVALDRTPMGDFVEIEGPGERLERLAAELELRPERAVCESYVTLWRRYRTEHPDLDLGKDMVFAE